MSNIASIVNLTAYQIFQNLSIASFIQKTHLGGIKPHECVIRSINYTADVADPVGTYLIYSTLTNGFIGSFSIGPAGVNSAVNTSPQTKIFLGNKANFSNDITFTIYSLSVPPLAPIQCSTLRGGLAVSLDFIEYKKK